MAQTQVRFEPGTHVTAIAGAAIDAGTLVVVTAGGINPTVGAATAGSRPFGIVAHSVKQGELVTILRGSVIARVKSTGVIAVGADVAAGAAGVVVAAAEGATVIGTAVEAAADNLVFIAL